MRRIIPVVRSTRAFVRFNSSASEASVSEDKALISSFSGIIPKLSVAYNTLMNSDVRAEFKKLVDEKVLIPSYPAALATFTTLQNPVLKKYKFNPVEFMEGATEAFRQLHLAMASTEFSKFCNEEKVESPKADLLKSSLSPYLFDACASAARQLYKVDKKVFMKDLNIGRRALLSIDTFVHVDLYAQNKKLVDDLVSAIKEETAAKVAASDPKDKESVNEAVSTATEAILESIEVESEQKPFTEGSVIVRATVMYEAEETYAETNNLNNTHSRLAHSLWTFEGCISGQTELDWQVVAFDGMGGQHNQIPVRITKKSSKEADSE